MAIPSYATRGERIWHYLFLFICGLVFLFLIGPLLVIIPLSFNAEPYFTFSKKMVAFDPAGYSLRWYQDFFTSSEWLNAIKNSFIIGIASTLLATVLGTVAALGLSSRHMPARGAIMALLISPMIVPLIISAAAMFFFFSKVNLAQTYV
ncbi:MAG: ABC transporter permease, partial [Halomonas glaciei]